MAGPHPSNHALVSHDNGILGWGDIIEGGGLRL